MRYCHGANGHDKMRMRRIRAARMPGMFEIHHVVPKQFATHPRIVEEEYDVEASYNLVPLPSKLATHHIRLRPSRNIHTGGHPMYNTFVRHRLDTCAIGEFETLIVLLHMGCRGFVKVPWKK